MTAEKICNRVVMGEAGTIVVVLFTFAILAIAWLFFMGTLCGMIPDKKDKTTFADDSSEFC